jgi:hypothetical protein
MMTTDYIDNDTRLVCDCGRTATSAERLAALPMFTLAVFSSRDKNEADHNVFDVITEVRDQDGNVWLDFNEGACPVCPDCIADYKADGVFREHDFETCDYVECAEMRHAWRRRCQAAGN